MEDKIKQYIQNNFEKYQQMAAEYKKRNDELKAMYPKELHEVIDEQAQEFIKREIVKDATKALAVSTEEVLLIVEDIKIELP